MSKVTELADDGLLRRMVAGDEEAFTLLYRRRQPAIYRFALHMSRNAAVAEDVTQEVFMTLIRDTNRFDPAKGTLSGFLFGIARNHLRKRWEQDRRTVALADEGRDLDHFDASQAGPPVEGFGHANGNGHGGGPHPVDQFESLENVGRVRQAISTLPENYREVVVLCELEDMSYEEAAAALECPVGTVRSRLHRARALLLEKLRDAQGAPRTSAAGERAVRGQS
ncbi:MAG TPA: sigma-70 family RNA polymerase sigma factor [Candidatus Acidoferrum sp.]|nr:sigma-70 family RNA polymerase sigma factor [Candidatus Acidoferrum sp.]